MKFSDEYLRLLDAVRAINETVKGVHEILHLFGQKVREIQQHVQLTGDAAKAYIGTYRPFEFAELLVYEKLPLAWAVAAFEHGIVIPMVGNDEFVQKR